MSQRMTYFKAALFVTIIGAVAALHASTDISSYLTTERIGQTIETSRRWIQGYGIYGPVIFVVAGALLTLVNTSAVMVIYAAVVLYGGAMGLLLSALATHLAANLIFFIGRQLGRDFVSGFFGRRLAKLDTYSREQGLTMVIYTRLIFFLAPGISWVLSVTNVSHRDYLLGTLLGTTPQFLIQVWLGSKIVSIIQEGRSLNPMKTPELLLPFAAALLFVLAAHMLKKAREKGS